MNINCIICSDLFVPTSVIYITRCGHIFHYTCLTTWIERSKTCPQCRNKTSEKTIFRVYFNIITLEGSEDDAVTLQSKLDAANLQLRLKEGHVKSTEDKIKSITNEKSSLEQKYKQIKQDLDKAKSGLSVLKEQLIIFKDKAKYVEKVETEIQQIKEDCRVKDQALKAITGDVEEATEIILHSACPQTLSVIATTLKREIMLIEKKKDKYFTLMKRAENDFHSCRKKLESMTVERNKLKLQLNAHTQCEQEMKELKKKISEMMETTTSVNPSLVRVATESPAPLNARKRSQLMGITSTLDADSPSISDRVKEIKESASPYLKVKSSSMGLLMKAQDTRPRFGSSEYSIFKKAMSSSKIEDMTITSIKKPLPDYSYDGLGGHSKDEKFPVPRQTTGIKRTKSAMSSSKYRKLAKPNKKLDDFLDISNLD